MLDDFLDWLKSALNSRFVPLLAIYVVIFSIIFIRIFNLQIVENDTLTTTEEKEVTKIRELKATRGRILDCNGVVLAENKPSYSVILEDSEELDTNAEKNQLIYTLIKILEKNKVELTNDFFISLDLNGNLIFKEDGDAQLKFKRDVYSLRSVDELTEEQRNATATDVYEFLKTGKGSSYTSMFGISDDYSLEDSLKIMQIRYYLMLNKYERYKPITIATNVNNNVVAAINEYSSEMPGVSILTETYRYYNESEYFAHIIGYTGLISTDKMNELNKDSKDKNLPIYSATDQIGKTGIEESLEEYLRGTKGYEEVILNNKSQVTGVKTTIDPVAGNDVYLSIDSTHQKAIYTMLEKELAAILLSKIINAKKVGTYESASDIEIPVYDVYYALIQNGIIDITRFNLDTANQLEKNIYQKYLKEREKVFAQLKKVMDTENPTPGKDLSEDMKEYTSYIYQFLKSKDVIITKEIDTSDPIYKGYYDGTVSLSEYLQHAFTQNWINLNKLNIDADSFYSTSELYEILLDYTFEKLASDTEFADFIYKILIQTDQLRGYQICQLLYIQGVLPMDKEIYLKLENGTMSAYSFVINKIKTLEITPGMLGLDPCSGSVVLTDVNTGKILAMVTYPSYDNNMLANSIDADYYSKLLKNESDILINRATQTNTAPGSTYKMLVAISGLEENEITSYEKIYDARVFEKIEGAHPKCHISTSHGNLNVVDAIGVSCNYYFYEVGYRLSLDAGGRYFSKAGLNKIEEYAKMFGFGEKTGIEVYEHSPKISDQDSVRTAIGQGNNAYAPIQISRYVTALANNGTVYKYTLIDKITDLNGKVILDNKPEVLNKVEIKKSTWDTVHEGMWTVVNGPKSSVKNLYKGLDLTVAGKTGTAQQVTTRPNHALFVSYAPYDNPEISVTSVIPFGYASYNAAELTSNVYKYYYKLEDTDSLLDGDVDAAQTITGVVE